MARIEVPMPQMGESIAEGTVSKWLKKVGDMVRRDEAILEISTDKVDAEIPSPSEGVVGGDPGSGGGDRGGRDDPWPSSIPMQRLEPVPQEPDASAAEPPSPAAEPIPSASRRRIRCLP